jgi:hypothetical protein
MTLQERAEIIKEMVQDNFCTHYPGYTCDREWSSDETVCPKCINSWFIRTGISRRDDPRLWKYAKGATS